VDGTIFRCHEPIAYEIEAGQGIWARGLSAASLSIPGVGGALAESEVVRMLVGARADPARASDVWLGEDRRRAMARTQGADNRSKTTLTQRRARPLSPSFRRQASTHLTPTSVQTREIPLEQVSF
jgi:hypothetical protein